MDALVPLFIAILLAETGSRTQMLVHGYARRDEGGPALSAALVCALVGYGVAAVGGSLIAPLIPLEARKMLLGVALLAAGLPLLMPPKQGVPGEGTSFLGKLLAFARTQFGDAGQFLVFAVAAQTQSPVLAVFGALAGCTAACVAPIVARDTWPTPKTIRLIRLIVAVVLAVIGAVLVVTAMGLT